uniref:Uncharacterized protein n=1 Tax=Tanacetum cinerariifolium TaxID=118510 RepID=A0A6L2JDH1_TANCI|nr:hypothetical protein [Tanacetum cinerariifolium]
MNKNEFFFDPKKIHLYPRILDQIYLGDGVDTQSKVHDEKHLKMTGADEGTDNNDDSNDDGGGSDDHDDDSDEERTESDRDDIPDSNLTNVDQTEHEEEEDVDERIHTPLDYELTDDEKIHDEENINDEERMDEEEEDEVTKELYKDVNVNLRNKDTKMTNVDQGGSGQQNVSQESGFEQEEEDAHVTLTPVLDTHKDDEPVQSSFVSSDFTSKLLNLENPSPADNKIASLMETSARHATKVPKITSSFTTTIPPPPLFFNPLPQQATPTPTPITSEATTSFPSLLDFSSVFRFNDRVTNLEKDLSEIKQVDQQEAQDEKNAYIELKNVPESLEAAVLARSSSQPKSTYEAAASLFEFELTKILLDNMEENKSHLRADYKKKLYDALIESYNIDKDLFNKYGEDQEFDMGNNDEQPADKEVSKEEWFKEPKQPPTPDSDWNKR